MTTPATTTPTNTTLTTTTNELAKLQPVTLDAGAVFSGKPSGVQINGYTAPCAYTPAINPDYLFQESARDIICWLLAKPEPLYLCGPTGCGKTSGIKQLAARLNYPVFEVTGHGRLELSDLLGHLTVKNNSMTFEYGPLALAMRYGGIFLFNEIDIASPDINAGLNTLLDGSPLCLAENGGELITPHPMFRFVATGNTAGSDDTGLYTGTLRQNMAFMDRFTIVEVDYPRQTDECALLERLFPSLPVNLCLNIVMFANEVRRLFVSGGNGTGPQVEVTFSTRSLIRWADLTCRYKNLASQGISPIEYALDRALAFRACKETRAVLHELCQRRFKQSTTADSQTTNK